MLSVPARDIQALIRDKYQGRADSAALQEDLKRLAEGEPLAYIIGWIPFLDLNIHLDSKPLIPRPETEYWTEKLVQHLKERFGDRQFRFLDLCAGSGAIGLAVLKNCPQALVSFGEVMADHLPTIQKNIDVNGLDDSRADIRIGDLFEPFSVAPTHFDVIATNPPYVPEDRALDVSVTMFEPGEALYSGPDGLSLIRRIAAEAPQHLYPEGELWMECDMDNIGRARDMLGTRATIHNDQYGRPRYVVAHW